ncbi:metallophosphoesterase family protein [Lactococcus lactis]|uniref:metallophosphoesterase n=1 Tax=Lactococcus lactis TaxID=1358 RepID=UPI00189748B0|nr:metallophosphoesterase [Lactococcus lactis]
MATLISPFKKLIFLISFIILLTGIFFGFVSIQNCVLNYNPPKTKSQIEQLVKKSADSSKTRFVSDDKHYQRNLFVSDIHGRLSGLKKTLTEIHFSKNDRLFVLGDSIDHGRFGFDALLYLLKTLPDAGYHVTVMMGNHEQMWSELASDGKTDEEQLSNAIGTIDIYEGAPPNGWQYSIENWKKLSVTDRQFLLTEMKNNFGQPEQLIEKIGNKWVVLSHSAKLSLSYEKEKTKDLFWEHLPGDSFERRNSVAKTVGVPNTDVQVFVGHVSGFLFGKHRNYICLDNTIVNGTLEQFEAVPVKIYCLEQEKFLG